MASVVIRTGKLAGRGVYAARDFDAGEIVVRYQLRPLGAAEYESLPAGDDLFVHSFGGRRYLYPAPARFVNHADDPSCYQDFDRCCDIALRPIAKGEAITIDATQETGRELATFLQAYDDALARRSAPDLGALLDETAVAWLPDGARRGAAAVIAGLLANGLRSTPDAEWLVGTGRWEAVGSLEGRTADGTARHLTLLLKVIRGNWQAVYLHVG